MKMSNAITLFMIICFTFVAIGMVCCQSSVGPETDPPPTDSLIIQPRCDSCHDMQMGVMLDDRIT